MERELKIKCPHRQRDRQNQNRKSQEKKKKKKQKNNQQNQEGQQNKNSSVKKNYNKFGDFHFSLKKMCVFGDLQSIKIWKLRKTKNLLLEKQKLSITKQMVGGKK